VRRCLLIALACLPLATGVSGCAGAEGKQAEALLQRAHEAQAAVRSERFVVRFEIEAEGHKLTMAMQGGAYLKGPRAGDFSFAVTADGAPELNSLDMTVVRHGGTATVSENGRTVTLSVPAVEQQFGSPTQFLELERYVKSVSVDEADLAGRPADRIVGTLDTQALVASAGGLATKALGSSGVHFGDTRAVLFIPRDTHLMEVMFADLDVHAGVHTAHMHISIATSGYNKPVAIPSS
jgi:hypothetical protein